MWGIPLARVASVLAVSYTGAGGESTAHAGAPPSVQRPEPTPPALPPDDPTAPTRDASTDPGSDAPTFEEAPEAPVEPSTAAPSPEEPGPLPADAPIDDEADRPAVDDEPSPIAEPFESPARAKAKALLRPTDNRAFFSMGVGGASAGSGYLAYYTGSGMDFQWEMAIGSHARKRPNFGGAFVFQQRKGFVNELSFVGRLQWDKPFTDSFALYSSVNLDFGVNVPIGYAGYFAFAAVPPSAMIGAGWGIKGILAERFLMWLRPVNPNLIAPAWFNFPPVTIRWDVTAGVGVVW